jgi:hypothetical protein
MDLETIPTQNTSKLKTEEFELLCGLELLRVLWAVVVLTIVSARSAFASWRLFVVY